MVGYIDSDYAGDLDVCKSTSRYMFHLGFGPICWQSKTQNSMALSSTKAEYQGAANAATEAIWLEYILKEFGFSIPQPTIVLISLFGGGGGGVSHEVFPLSPLYGRLHCIYFALVVCT